MRRVAPFAAIKGMNRDLAVSKFSSEFAYEIKNMRIMPDKSNTLMALVNEKGNKQARLKIWDWVDTAEPTEENQEPDSVWEFKPITDNDGEYVYQDSIQGTPIGQAVIDNTLVLFTNDNGTNWIYKIWTDSEKDILNIFPLFHGELDMDEYNPAETIVFYENKELQKVYWVDGKNQPRLINIAAGKSGYDKWFNTEGDSFNFVRKINFVPNDSTTVTVKRDIVSNGIFSAGVIQYVFTYIDQYMQETNPFYTSALYYTSYSDRGGNPEETVSNSFTITVIHPDTDFEYVRIYSILRTSLEAETTCKLIAELAVNGVDEDDTLTYVDTGTTGSVVDPTELLYVGGEQVTAGTIEQKDNTLFLGDIELTRKYITQLLNIVPQEISSKGEPLVEDVTIPVSFVADKTIEYPDSNNSYYPYSNSLSKSSQEIKTFKCRESYRFGIQAQYETGKWSEAVWIGDFTNNTHPAYVNNTHPDYEGSVFSDGNIKLVQAKATIPESILSILKAEGYVRIRPVIVYPDFSSRACICQGVLCPTVFNVSDRYENGPYAQSSWFVRPNAPVSVSELDNDVDIQYGAYAEFRDLHPLPSCEHRNCEIQCLRNVPSSPYLQETDSDGNVYNPDANDAVDFMSSYQEHFFVDQSIITMHSPDVEFDNDVKVLDLSQLNMRIVGIVPLTAYNSAIDIQTSTPALSPSEHSHSHKDLIKGFYSEPISVPHDFDNGGSRNAWKARISGIWWLDYNIAQDYTTEHWYKDGRRDDVLWGYAVYPWHRNGSLNNQSGQDTNGYRTAMLDRKKISNSRTSYKTWFFDVNDEKEYEVSGATLWDSDEQTLIRIPSPCDGVVPDINYYGNIDKVVTVTRKLTTASTEELGKHKTQAVDEDGKLVYEVDENGDRIVDSDGNYIPVYETDEEGDIYEEYDSDEDFDSSSGYPIMISVNYNTRWNVRDYLGNDNQGLSIYNKWHDLVTDHDIYTGKYIDIGTGINSDESSTVKLEPDGEDTISSESPLYGSDPIRMKYKSTPHIVMALKYNEGNRVVLPTVRIDGQAPLNPVSGSTGYPFWSYNNRITTEMEYINFDSDKDAGYGWLWLGELYREKVESRFGGTTPEAMESNVWLPCGEAVDIPEDTSEGIGLVWSEGDTYYMRYDHIKTYPYTLEDQNSITDIISFLCETRVNLDGRYDRNRGQVDNLSITPENFNIMNDVYNQTNDFFAYTTINENKINLDNFSNVITWTKTKTAGDLVDTWTNITMASTLDLDGDKGKVNKLKRFNNDLLAFQDTGISQILYNETMQIASTEGVPIEIANSGKVQGKRYIANQAGCINKWSICETPAGLYFIDDINKTMYLFNGQFSKLSEQFGFTSWINSQLGSMEAWNPYFPNIVTYYDKCNHDVYFINDSYCLAFSESMGQFTSFYDYNNTPYFANIDDRGIWIGKSHFDTLTEHEYKLWLHNEGEYNSYFNETMSYWLTVVANPEMQMDKVFDNIEFRSDTYSDDLGLLHSRTFDTLRAYNEYQDTGEVSLRNIWAKPSSTSNLKKKFRIWRAIIPRDKNGNGRNRIRNPWTYLTLKMKDPQNYKTILHDLMVYYFDSLPSSSNNGNSNEE